MTCVVRCCKRGMEEIHHKQKNRKEGIVVAVSGSFSVRCVDLVARLACCWDKMAGREEGRKEGLLVVCFVDCVFLFFH